MRVVTDDVKDRCFAAVHLVANEFEHQSASKASALEIWVSTYAANLPKRAGLETLASHCNQARSSKKPKYSPSLIVRTPNGPGRVNAANSSAWDACS